MRFSAPLILLVATAYTLAAPITIPREDSVSGSRVHIHAKRTDYGIDGLEDLSKRAIENDGTNPPTPSHSQRHHLIRRTGRGNQGGRRGSTASSVSSSSSNTRPSSRTARVMNRVNRAASRLRNAVTPNRSRSRTAAGTAGSSSRPPRQQSPPPSYVPSRPPRPATPQLPFTPAAQQNAQGPARPASGRAPTPLPGYESRVPSYATRASQAGQVQELVPQGQQGQQGPVSRWSSTTGSTAPGPVSRWSSTTVASGSHQASSQRGSGVPRPDSGALGRPPTPQRI